MNAMERRIARLENAANISTIDIAVELTARLAAMRTAKRSNNWREPTREEKLARWRAVRAQPLTPEAADLVERFIAAHELGGRDDHARQD